MAANILANYEIGESIGMGRFAQVFLATRRDLGQKVALKILLPQWYENNAVREQFMQQARAIAKLKHPRIVGVLDLGEESGRMYMALEYLPLGDLQAWLSGFKQTRPALVDVTLLVEDVAAALDFIHKQALVHGDVKPGNILLVDEKGVRHAKLSDLGMLSAIQKAVTASGTSLYPSSSPLYLSPEQANDQPPLPASDQYALGIVTYEMLTGQVPFSGDSDVTIYRSHKNDIPQPPSALRTDLPSEIDSVLLQALAKDPKQRYPDCAAFARALRQAVEVAEQKRFENFLKKARAAQVNGNHVDALAAIESAHQIKPDDPEVKTLREQIQKTALAASSYDEAAKLYESARTEAQTLRAEALDYPDPDHLLDELAPKPPAPWQLMLRRWRPALLTCAAALALLLLGGLGAKIVSAAQPAGAPLRSTLVPLVWTATLTFTPTLTPTFTSTFTPTATATFTRTLTPTKTPTPTPLVLKAGNTPQVMLLRRMVGLEAANWVYSIAFSPDGKLLAGGLGDATVRVWNVSTGELIATLKHDDYVYSVAFSPDGELLASGSGDNTVRIWNVRTGELIKSLNHDDSVYTVAFSPNGELLASGSADNTVQIWNVSTGERVTTIMHSRSVNTVAFSPNGELLASSSGEATIKLWDGNTGTIQGIPNGSPVHSIAFSPDGKSIASNSLSDTIALWDFGTGQLIKRFDSGDTTYDMAFSPNGELLVSRSGGTTIKLWDVNTGLVIQDISRDNTVYGVNAIAFSPDGWWLASGSYNELFLWGLPRWNTTGTPTLAPTSTITSTPTTTSTATLTPTKTLTAIP